MTDARRSAAITKATTDANDRVERWKRAGVLAAQMGRDPSVAGSDFLNDAAGIQTLKDFVLKSAHIAMMIGGERQQAGRQRSAAADGQLADGRAGAGRDARARRCHAG